MTSGGALLLFACLHHGSAVLRRRHECGDASTTAVISPFGVIHDNRLFLVCACSRLHRGVATSAEHWPQWRGPLLNGISGEKGLPGELVDDRERRLEARRAGAVGRDADRLGRARLPERRARAAICALWAVDRSRGTVRWKRPLGGGNRRMMKQHMSSPSPVTDGRSVWVMTGTGVLKAFDFEGKELWSRNIQQDYGRFGLQWGYASSPLLHERCAVRAGPARHAHRRSVIPPADRQGDRQDGVARRTGRRMRGSNRPTRTRPRRCCATAARQRS